MPFGCGADDHAQSATASPRVELGGRGQHCMGFHGGLRFHETRRRKDLTVVSSDTTEVAHRPLRGA